MADEPDRAVRGESDAPGSPAGPATRPAIVGRAERGLAAALYLAVIPVVVLALAALGAFVYGAAVFVHLVGNIVSHPFPVGHQVGLFLLDTDLFLIGATLLISAVGFYELFVREIPADSPARMPAWLEMHDLNDLKGRIVAMIVMVLAVSFVELAVDADGGGGAADGLHILEIGGGVAAVILALTVFLRMTGHPGER
jgi:uncharacterized membrane protein YqhA